MTQRTKEQEDQIRRLALIQNGKHPDLQTPCDHTPVMKTLGEWEDEQAAKPQIHSLEIRGDIVTVTNTSGASASVNKDWYANCLMGLMGEL